MKNSVKIVSVIIGTLIGAGFASGQEIYLFFGSYGIKGIYGILVSSLFTGIIIYKVFSIISNSNINTYNDFLANIINKSHINKSKTLNITFIINIIINIFLLISFFIMIAGFDAYFVQEFNLPNFIGSSIIAVLCIITFNKNINGIIKANTILVPSIIILILFLGLKNINTFFTPNLSFILTTKNTGNWLLDSILYSSYNSIILIPILITLKDFITAKKIKLTVTAICVCLLILLSISIFGLLLLIDIDVTKIEIPMLYITGCFGTIYKYVYGIVILISIFTSAISAGYGFLESFKSVKIYKYISILMCIAAVFVSNIGFSYLVTIIYPIFGYIGLIQILIILLKKKAKTDITLV